MKKLSIAVIAAVVVAGGGIGAYLLTRPDAMPVDAPQTEPAGSTPAESEIEQAGEPSESRSQRDDVGVLFYRGKPSSLLDLGDGSVLVADLAGKLIWKVDGDKTEAFAGTSGGTDRLGQALGGYHDALLEDSLFQTPWAMAAFRGGYAVSDTKNQVIRLILSGSVYTMAGTGDQGSADGNGLAASFSDPTGLAVGDGVLYIADTGNHAIRAMDEEGNVTTFAGGAKGCIDGPVATAAFNEPTGLYWQGGALYVADSGNHMIRKIENGRVTTVAGTVVESEDDGESPGDYLDGPALEAAFSHPQGVAVAADGAVYIADTGNSAVRRLKDGKVDTLAKADPKALDTYPVSPRGLLLRNGSLFVADTFAGIAFEIPLQ